ncbi:CDC6 [Sanghuangporus sanghuang]
MPASSPSTPSTRRLTRSQTATSVLGKRTSLSRSSSVVSNRSTGMMTPESTPTTKRKRTVTARENDDGTGNKENIPPPPMFDFSFLDSPRSRMSRRSSFSSDISSVSMISRSSMRRTATYGTIPRTPSSVFDSFSVSRSSTPPPSPPTSIPLHVRVRGLLRTTSDSTYSMSLEGREAERAVIESFLHSLDSDPDVTESVLYVSGSPGTGKTALVNSIITSAKVADDVKVVFINCMAITGMDALWEKLAEELFTAPTRGRGSGKKIPAKDKVCSIFEKQRDLKCILVLDELDNLASASSNDIQSLFSLAAAHPSMLRIMGIANTHTLTSASSILPLPAGADSATSSTSSSKGVKVKTIHFAPYSPIELLAILNKRFEDLPQDELKKLLPPSTLTLLTKKISALTGDVRVLFEVLRGAIDTAIPSSSDASASSSDAAAKVAVLPAHILSALKAHAPSSSNSKSKSGSVPASASGNSDVVSKVRGLGLQQRLVLLAIVLASKRRAATLPLALSRTSSFTSITPPSTPTKRQRSPMKRSSSNGSVGENATTRSGVDSSQLYSYYSSLLASSDAFTPLSRSEFSDLLGILETTGLATLSAQTTRSLKRCSSFIGSVKSNSASGAPNVSLQAHVREGEVSRGLGIGAESPGNSEGDALEDGVRSIWSREMSQIRREAKAKDALSILKGVEGFEDAIQG